jgi:hypothetical protein
VEEIYDRWRLGCPTPEELREDVLAVKASLRDMASGQTGRALDEFASDFRARHKISDGE